MVQAMEKPVLQSKPLPAEQELLPPLTVKQPYASTPPFDAVPFVSEQSPNKGDAQQAPLLLNATLYGKQPGTRVRIKQLLDLLGPAFLQLPKPSKFPAKSDAALRRPFVTAVENPKLEANPTLIFVWKPYSPQLRPLRPVFRAQQEVFVKQAVPLSLLSIPIERPTAKVLD